MARMALAAAVVLGLAGFAPARGQFWGGPAFGYRAGFGVAVPGFRAGWYTHGFYAAPVLPSVGWWPAYGPGYGPGYGNPFFLPPPGGAYPFPYPPVIVVQQPVVVIGGTGSADTNVAPAGGFAPAALNVPPPGAKQGDYLVISPRKDRQAIGQGGYIAPVIDRVAPPPMPVKPPAFDSFAAKPVGAKNTDRPEADPAAESARQVRLGRAAFAAEEYGLAADHFDRAAQAKPEDPLPLFLRAQAHFAAGRYADAVADIRDGMKKAPDWPAAKFDPKELYGPAADRFEAHLAALRKAVAANPADPALAFLLGYELWFTGDRPAAMQLFRDAAKLTPGNAMVGRFLKEADRK